MMQDDDCALLGGIPDGLGACRIPDKFIDTVFEKSSCQSKLQGTIVNLEGIRYCSIDTISEKNFTKLYNAATFYRDVVTQYGFGNWHTFDKKLQEMLYKKKFTQERFYDLAYFHPYRVMATGFMKSHVFEIGSTLKKLLVLSSVPKENQLTMLPFNEIFLDIDFTKEELANLGAEVDFDRITGILVQKLEIRKRKAKRFYRDGKIEELEIAPVENVSKKVGEEKTDEYADADIYPDSLERITHQSKTYKDIVEILKEQGKDFKKEVENYPHCKKMMVNGKVMIECVSEEPGAVIGNQMVLHILGEDRGEEFFEQYTTDININVEKEKADEAYEGDIHRQSKKFAKYYVINFLNFLNDPEVQFIEKQPDEERQRKRRAEGKPPMPPRAYIRLTGEKKRYIDSLSLDRDVWKVSHRFWVRGHYRTLRHPRYGTNVGKKMYIFAFIKGRGLTIEKKYKADIEGSDEVDSVSM